MDSNKTYVSSGRLGFQLLLSFALVSTIQAGTSVNANAAIWNNERAAESGTLEVSHALALIQCEDILLKLLLSSHGKSDTEKLQSLLDAELLIEKFAAPSRTVLQAGTAEEFKAIEKLAIPTSWRLDEDVRTLKVSPPSPFILIAPTSDEVRTLVDAKLMAQSELLRKQLADAGLRTALRQDLDEASVRKNLLAYLADPKAMHGQFKIIPEETRLKFINALHAEIDRAISMIDSAGDVVANSKDIKLPNAAFQRFFQIMLSEYFRNLDHRSKLDIVAGLLKLPPTASDRDRFEVMVMNTGPQFQKLFQVYAREEGFSEELKSVFKLLEQSAKPIPWRLVEPIVRAEKVPFSWVSIDPQPLGVGTMAQVHRARVRFPNEREENVVVRLLKPGISERVEADKRILARVAEVADSDPLLRRENFPLMTPFLEQIDAMTANETRLARTVADQIKGGQVYARELQIKAGGFDGKLNLRAPGLIDLGPESKVMVQEFIDGTSFEKFERSNPKLAHAVLENLVTVWVEETLFGSGFYHADLHQGNLRVRRDLSRVVVNILDFGMTGQLDRTMQDRFIAFGLAAEAKDASVMARALWELSVPAQNEISVSQLEAVLKAEIDNLSGSRGASKQTYEWIALAVNAGLRFPMEFTTLNRGMALMTRMVDKDGSSNRFRTIVKSIVKRHPERLTSLSAAVPSVGKTEWLKIIWSQVSSAVMGGDSTPTDVKPNTSVNPSEVLCRDIFVPKFAAGS